LFWWIFAANAAVMTVGLLILILTPISVSSNMSLPEAADLAGGLLVLLAVNFLVLRSLLRPLARLVRQMEQVDLLRARGWNSSATLGEVAALEQAFDDMLGRLEAERREAAARVLGAQEEERRRIARELHDAVGQAMTGILFQLSRAKRRADPHLRPDIAEAMEAVRGTLEDVRRIAQELRPEALDHLGLPQALNSLALRFSNVTDIATTLDLADELPPLEPEAEMTLYRVAQEGLTNVARHSEATDVLLSLRSYASTGRPRNVVLRIADNGHGFANDVSEGGGLRGIRERALIVNGSIAIKPSAAGGIEIRLEVPATTASR
jgi:two-component system sensor histidine kinase UhpB